MVGRKIIFGRFNLSLFVIRILVHQRYSCKKYFSIMGAASSVKVEKEENSKNLPRRRTGRRGSAIDPEAMKDEVLVNEAAQLAVFSKMRKEYEVLMENEVPYKAIFESLKRVCVL